MGEAGIETAYCTDNPFLVGPRFGELPAHARRGPAELSRRARTASSTSRSSARRRAARSSATCCRRCPTPWRSGGCARWRAGTASTGARRRQFPTARVMRAGINLLDDLKKKRPFFLGVDAFDPHEPLDAPQAFQLAAGSPEGHRARGHHADPAVRDALLVGRRRGRGRPDPPARPRAVCGRGDLRGRVDRPADERAGRPEAARRDRRLLHLRPRPDARRGRDPRQARRPRPVAHLPRALHDPAPGGQAAPARRATTSPRPTTCRRRCSRSWASGARA